MPITRSFKANSPVGRLTKRIQLRQTAARHAALHEKPLHDLHHAVRLQLMASRAQVDDSARVARGRRIALQLRKDQAVAAARKAKARLAAERRRKAEGGGCATCGGGERDGEWETGPPPLSDGQRKNRERIEAEGYERVCAVQQLVNGWVFQDEETWTCQSR